MVTLKRSLSILFILALVALFSGCAHQVDIAPKLTDLGNESISPKIDKAVGYYISKENRALKLTTPAGGGDSVRYTPYADLEPGLNLVLSNIFTATYKIEDINDRGFLESKNIFWVFTPTITTTSSSRNSFFWPPTDFSVTLNCTAVDNTQKQVWNTTVQADNDPVPVKETIKDHGLAGRKAAEKALKKLQSELIAAPVFRQ